MGGQGGRGGGTPPDDGGLRQQDLDAIRRQQQGEDLSRALDRAVRENAREHAHATTPPDGGSGGSVVDELKGDEPLVGIGRNERPTLTYGMLRRAFGDRMARRITDDPTLLWVIAGCGMFVVASVLLSLAIRSGGGETSEVRATATPSIRATATVAATAASLAVTPRPTAVPLASITINPNAVARIQEIQRQENDEQGPNLPLAVAGAIFALGGVGALILAAGRMRKRTASGARP